MASKTKAGKYIYFFGGGKADGNESMKNLLGGKGANLAEMAGHPKLRLPVPPGFTVTTEVCTYCYNNKKTYPKTIKLQVDDAMSRMEKLTGKKFGDEKNPLLVSIRSGARRSMPGMMETVLNVGLNDKTIKGVIAQSGDERFAYDAYRRLIMMYADVVMEKGGGIEVKGGKGIRKMLDEKLEHIKHKQGYTSDTELTVDELKALVKDYKATVKKVLGSDFPDDPWQQMWGGIGAVFSSWNGKRAVEYRRIEKIPDEWGTAVNVQAMVFGNMGNDCATGVGFTRDPGTGENVMFGEYLTNAQGEDVVAGIRTPKPVAELATEMPDLFKQLEGLRNKLETHYKEVQDFEYTIEKGILFCLQTRNGKMNTVAMVRTSVEMVKEGLITKEQALLRIKPDILEQLLHPRLDSSHKVEPLAQGLPASPGAASGHVVFDADRAELLGRAGEKVILVREETKPEDIHGFFASQGILTSRGGKTSHAAVVARGMGKPCVAGAEGIKVDVKLRQAEIGDKILREGDYITIDGGTGFVYPGIIPTVEPTFSDDLKTLLGWADEVAKLKVYANADTPGAADKALTFGAMGIGLCRTERMFNDVDRLPIVVEMILAATTEERESALNRLKDIQRKDFREIFTAMKGKPVTVRLLDPPIHEFLPTEDVLRDEVEHLQKLKGTVSGVTDLFSSLRLLNADLKMAERSSEPFTMAGVELIEKAIEKKGQMLRKVRELHEVNPMLGHRGVRLGLTFPEIYRMQIQAILEAAAECQLAKVDARPEIMVPQVCTAEELEQVKVFVDQIRTQIETKNKINLQFKFGTMIEVVRACLQAEELANVAEFFSFGTNDLTQATFSFSREDAENKFLPFYISQAVLKDNPFEVLDRKAMGKLMRMAVEDGRKNNKDLKVGICGEHGGHPESIMFCHEIGLNYVSCSGPRVPVARLAAAHAKLLSK